MWHLAPVKHGCCLRRWTLICLSLSVAVVNTTFSLLAPIFPEVATAKGVGATMTGFIFSGYSIVTVLASPFIGQMLTSRYITRVRCLLGGILLVGVSSAAFGLVVHIHDTDVFIAVCVALRFVLGLGCAMVDTSSTAIVAALYGEDSQLGTAMGLVEACLGVGWVIGPAFGGFLAEMGGFGLPFYVAGATTLVLGPVPVMISGKRLDVLAKRIGKPNQESLTVWNVVALPAIQMLLLTAVLGAAAVTYIDPTLQPHMQQYGYSVSFVGGAFALLSLVYAVAAPIIGWVSDTHGHNPMIMTGCIITALSFVMLGPMPGLGLPPANTALLMISVIIMGAGSCMVFVPALSAMMTVTQERFGKVEGLEDIVSGLLNSSYYFGGGLAPMIGGAVTEQVGFALSNTYFGAVMLGHFFLLLVSFRCGPEVIAPPTDGVPLLQSSARASSGKSTAAVWTAKDAIPTINPLAAMAVQGKRKKPETDGFLNALVR